MERRNEYITPKEAVDTIEEAAGKFPGYRRAHAKGIAFDAEFVPNGSAALYTKALHLQQEPVQTIVRFSHSNPTPDPVEWLMPIKGMAVRFLLPKDKFTNLTMANISVFPTKTPEAFIRLIKVMTRGTMSLRDKWSVLRKDPEYRTLPSLLKQLKSPVSFTTETYNALHSYYLVNEDGERQAVRFSWYPILDGEKVEEVRKDRTDLEAELLNRMENGKVRFQLMIQIAEIGDPVDDSSVIWPADRKLINAGVLTLQSVREDAAESFVFDPAIEVEGLELSDDPVLHYRSEVYAESSERRISERKE